MDAVKEEESYPADANPESTTYELSTKILPQFCIILDAENDFLKQRV